MMKGLLLAAVAVGAAVTAAAPAEARQGCGAGFHRGPQGRCRPNAGPGRVVVVRPAIGVYYGGRGWWDGRRYWQHRYRYNRGWRYR